jgi:hypothetical protein
VPAFEFVSPVGTKKNVLKSVPGWNDPFSGRLNGVPLLPWLFTPFAARLASNGAVPSVSVSWIVTQRIGNESPECRRS